jgi:hypothetical protein
MDIANLRLTSQHIASADFATAKDVVSHMVAMQAQDYHGALWAIALRTPGLTKKDVEQAIIDRHIVRTWPMRGTLHFLAAEDARWVTALLAPRAIAMSAGRLRQLELDETVLKRAEELIVRALNGGNCLTRTELCDMLDKNAIISAGQRGLHILHYLAETGVLCFGPHKGKQPTFVLTVEWLPKTAEKPREEALGELAARYFISHGPATLRDFAGWSNLTVRDAKLGIELARGRITNESIEGTEYWFDPGMRPAASATFLLPGFDEYMLGYKDRSAALPVEFSDRIIPGGNGMFLPTLVIDGKVEGTWKRTERTKSQSLTITPFEALTKEQTVSIDIPARRYEAYSGLAATWTVGN